MFKNWYLSDIIFWKGKTLLDITEKTNSNSEYFCSDDSKFYLLDVTNRPSRGNVSLYTLDMTHDRPLNLLKDKTIVTDTFKNPMLEDSDFFYFLKGHLERFEGKLRAAFSSQNDAPELWGLGFQDGVSPANTGIVELHDNIFFYLVVIGILVFWMLGSTIYNFNYNKVKMTLKNLVHGTLIEVLWTIFPALVLIAIAIPSFKLLYILDEVSLPTITIKATGNQWFWSYEYSDYETESGDPIEFDSYMKPDSDLELGEFRLLEVDNPIVIPTDTHVRIIVTSRDVLHDFALPSAGIKIDASPGRLNQVSLLSNRNGSFFGQCSELCGAYHGFMPIECKSVDVEEYVGWLSTFSLGSGLVLTSVAPNSTSNVDNNVVINNEEH
jgi:cytochrome c oxidase subunit 2